MKIVIIGAGEEGSYLAKLLAQEKHEIVVVDHNPAKVERVEELLDVRGVVGHGSSAAVLELAGVFSCDLLIAATNNDEVNLLAARLGKCQGAKRAVVRVQSSDYLGYHRYFYQRHLGFDALLMPSELCAQEIVELVRQNQAVAVEKFAGGQIQMRRVVLTEGSALASKSLAKSKIPKQCLVTALIRDHQIIIPTGDTILQVGDDLLVIGKAESMDHLEREAGREVSKGRSVILVGGGEIGLSVARSLDYTPVRVKLVEEDKHRALELAEELDRVEVIQGDGTDLELLTELGVKDSDVYVSACGEDEKNLLGCQLAKNYGAKKTIALVKKPDYITLYQKLGVDAAISPRVLLAQHVLRYVRSGHVSSIAVIEEGKAEVVEMRAEEGSKIVSAPLAKVGFPAGAIVGSIVREGKVIIPRGADQVQAGDVCIVFAFLSSIPALEKIFSGPKS